MPTETTFQVISAVLFFAGFSISVYFRRKADQSGEKITFEEENQTLLRVRTVSALIGYLTILAYMIHPPFVAWAQLDLPQWLRWLGATLMALMVPMFYWLFSSLGRNITKTVAVREEHQLVTNGPYRWVRHPLYSCGWLFFIGFSLLAANWLMALSLLVASIPLAMRTPVEEAKLIDRFGEQYQEYMQRTGRYFPKLGRNRGNIW